MSTTTSNDKINPLSQLAQEVNTHIDHALRADLEQSLKGCDPALVDLIEYAMFGGGKRIRPLLVVTCSRLCGTDTPELYRLATAFEYLHVASLVHDDIIDNATQRRGRSSLVAEYGQAKAILAGDWLLSRSMFIIAELTGTEGLTIFCAATEGMVDGEFLQNRHVAHVDITEAEYFAVIAAKTGNLIASACAIGALFGGATDSQRHHLQEYGSLLGLAFQVVDDLLDYSGDAQKTGKAVGNDLVEGKMTLPLIRALEQASQEDRAQLTSWITSDRELPATFEHVSQFIRKYQGFDSARQTAAELLQQAKDQLDSFQDPEVAAHQAALAGLADYILVRNK